MPGTAKRIIVLTMLAASSVALTSHSLATDSHMATQHRGQYPQYPRVNYGLGARAQMIKRGEYLTKIGDCIACHTEPGSKQAFAGGLAIPTPYGTIYTPNITSDKKNGIGNWTDKQFITAMRQGISPSGHYYYPAFPFYYFNHVTTQDLLAIKAYLNAIQPIKKYNRKSDLMFPLNIRFFQIGWRVLFFRDRGRFTYDPKQTKFWNRGKYLVDGLGHCGMCHTPTYHLVSSQLPLAAPKQKYYLTGGFVDGFYAPNITSSALLNTSLRDIENIFLGMRPTTSGEVLGPLHGQAHESLKYLTHADAHSIATYLKSVKSKLPAKPKITAQHELGQRIYQRYCASCHTNGAGNAPRLGDHARWVDLVQRKGMNVLYLHSINGINTMPARGTCMNCTNKEIQAAVRYLIMQSIHPNKDGS